MNYIQIIKTPLCNDMHPTVELMELWTVFHEHYSLLGQSRNMGHFLNILLIFRVILILLCP